MAVIDRGFYGRYEVPSGSRREVCPRPEISEKEMSMFDRRIHIPLLRPFFLSIAIVLFVAPLLHAQAQIKVGDNIVIRFGVLAQGWADTAQDATTKKYANNLFIRRIRFLVGGQISPNVSFFYETDNPNLGKATTAGTTTTKTISSGFITQDAFLEWKPTGSNAFMIDGGLMLPPLCRNCLESAATLLSLDYGSYSFTESAATQSVVGRDTGFQAKGYLAGGHFEYRGAIFQGFRASGSRNSLRTSGRVSYNPWDTESGYVYPGLYLGNKHVLQIGAGFDHQMDYQALSVDGFLSQPMGKNAINAELTLLSFDGGKTFSAIPEQKAYTAQAGYYFAGPKMQPWLRLENQDFKASANNFRDNKRQSVGLTWLPSGNNFNIKGAYSRVDPRVGNKTNEYTVQMQFFYY